MKVGQQVTHKKPNQDDSLIPIINIVFLMLIFFMVAGHIGETELLKVEPPSSVSDKHRLDEQLDITISKDGRLAFDHEFVEKEQLLAVINQRFADTPDEQKQQFHLLVKVDGDLAVEALQEVLSIIKQSGIKRVSLATQKASENS